MKKGRAYRIDSLAFFSTNIGITVHVCGAQKINLPRSKNAPQERFCPPERTAGTSFTGRGCPALGGAPWGGAGPLRPAALLRLPVSAAGGGRLRSNSSYGSTKITPSLSWGLILTRRESPAGTSFSIPYVGPNHMVIKKNYLLP